MKKFAFLVLAFIIFASANFAQKPAATSNKKSAAPIKKDSVPPTKKTTAATTRKEAAPPKKTAADTTKKTTTIAKKETAPSKKEPVKKKSDNKETAKKETTLPIKKTNVAPIKSEVSAKKSAPPAEKIAPPIKQATLADISKADWKILIDNLQSEQWTRACALAADYLKKLTVENDEKQLAQLRYFRLYALAGEIVAFHEAKSAVEENAAWATLDRTISEFNGKELILPPYQFRADCRASVNFVCPVKDDDHALRVTATNKEGTAIYSFNYVSFDDKIAFGNFDGGKIFLGGKLRRAEFNQDLSKPWLMRLFFDDGFITRADVN